MTNDRLFYSLTESSLFDTYLIYGIIGLLILVALIGLIVLFITSCCCFYSMPSCFCCYYHRRHLSYKLNKRFKEQDDMKKIASIKRHSSDITNFSQLYDSCPRLINGKTMRITEINNKNLDSSCTTINTLVGPASPCSSFIESIPSPQNNLRNSSQPNIHKINISTKGVDAQPFAYIKNADDRRQISRRLTPHDRSISPAIVSIDIARISSSNIDNTNNQNPSFTNIYETVTPTTNMNSSSNRSTPIYETEWTYNLKQLIMSKIPSMKENAMCVIELPLSTPDLVPSFQYFQQQHPYDKFLANRTKTSDSMRRANMLRRLKDDAAFLY